MIAGPNPVEQIRARLTPRQMLHVECASGLLIRWRRRTCRCCSTSTTLAASTTCTRSARRSASSRRRRWLHDITATHARGESAEIVGADVAGAGPLVVILLVPRSERWQDLRPAA